MIDCATGAVPGERNSAHAAARREFVKAEGHQEAIGAYENSYHAISQQRTELGSGYRPCGPRTDQADLSVVRQAACQAAHGGRVHSDVSQPSRRNPRPLVMLRPLLVLPLIRCFRGMPVIRRRALWSRIFAALARLASPLVRRAGNARSGYPTCPQADRSRGNCPPPRDRASLRQSALSSLPPAVARNAALQFAWVAIPPAQMPSVGKGGAKSLPLRRPSASWLMRPASLPAD